jgi:hypothetical protein
LRSESIYEKTPAAQHPLAADGGRRDHEPPRLKRRVDMTSVVNCIEIVTKGVYISALRSLVLLLQHTRVDAEAGPVLPTVDPADIRGLGTTVL